MDLDRTKLSIPTACTQVAKECMAANIEEIRNSIAYVRNATIEKHGYLIYSEFLNDFLLLVQKFIQEKREVNVDCDSIASRYIDLQTHRVIQAGGQGQAGQTDRMWGF